MPVCKGLGGVLASTLGCYQQGHGAASGLRSEDNYHIQSRVMRQ
jgi:hypothetical protein